MITWKYNTLFIAWDKEKGWWANIGGKEILGLNECLNVYGKQGWELVGIIPNFGTFRGSKVKDYGGAMMTEIYPHNLWNAEMVIAYFKRSE